MLSAFVNFCSLLSWHFIEDSNNVVFCYCMDGPDCQAVWDRRWMKPVMERRSMLHSTSQCLQHFNPVSSYRTMAVVPQTHMYEPPKKHSTNPLFSLMLGRLRQLSSLLLFSIDYDIDDDCLSWEIWPVMNTNTGATTCQLGVLFVTGFFNLAWPISARTNATLDALLALLPTPHIGKI